MVRKPILTPKALTIPEAKAALDKALVKCGNHWFGTRPKVACKAEMIRQANFEDKKVRFATFMDPCHLKNSELEKKF